MNTRTLFNSALIVSVAAGSLASASEVISYNDPLILSPCDDAIVTVEWLEDNAGWPGTLSWVNPDIENGTTSMFYSETVSMGDKFVLDRTYALGERVDFMYVAGWNAQHTYRTDFEDDWGQFKVTQTDSSSVILSIEDIPLYRSDYDFNDAVFRVSFSHVPAPGSLVFLGSGLLAAGIRRRR
jgi:hypothetical protein